MTKVEYLRSWLADKGYHFTAEHLVWDKDFLYPILSVRGGRRRKLTDVEAYGGVALDSDPLYAEYLDQQIRRLETRLNGLAASQSAAAKQEAAEWSELCAALRDKREGLT